MPCIAVIDVETTGLFPQRHHRIVEIAAIVTHMDGTIAREFVTLVNPERDLGPTSIHGLSARDVHGAPRFRDVAGDLLESLSGCVAIAGHNVRFDNSFLVAEFQRLSVSLPNTPGLCTMNLAGGGSLSSVCRDYGIEFAGEAHSAHDDATATARLLVQLLRSRQDLVEDIYRWSPISWPAYPRCRAALATRRSVRSSRSESPTYLSHLVSKLPVVSMRGDSDEAALAYLDLLARVLDDRRIDPSEGEALFELASAWGMTRDCIAEANRRYLDSLAIVALSDGVLTDSEHRDLYTVASLLGIERVEADAVLQNARLRLGALSVAPGAIPENSVHAPSDELRGKTVCFTGECQCRLGGDLITRTRANELASRLGLIPATGVTKKLDLLVVADGFTESGKARKAREYGIRIIHESVFWRMIGLEVE